MIETIPSLAKNNCILKTYNNKCYSNLSSSVGCVYYKSSVLLQIVKTLKGIPGQTPNCIWCWGSSPGELGNVE